MLAGLEFALPGFPTLLVVDQSGVVRDLHTGCSPKFKERVIESLERLLKANRK